MNALLLITLASLSTPGDFAGITPGRTTLAEAEAVLGAGRDGDSGRVYDGAPFGAGPIRLAASPVTGVVEWIALRLVEPAPAAQVCGWLGLDPAAGVALPPDPGEQVVVFPAAGMALRSEGGPVVEVLHLAPSFAAAVVESLPAPAPEPGPGEWLARAEERLDAGEARAAAEAAARARALDPHDERADLIDALVEGVLALDLAPRGVLGLVVSDGCVVGVVPDGPAARAGVRPGDHLLAVYGERAENSAHLADLLDAVVPGEVGLELGRDGRRVDLVALALAREDCWSHLPPPADEVERYLRLAAIRDDAAAWDVLHDLVWREGLAADALLSAGFLHAAQWDRILPATALDRWRTWRDRHGARAPTWMRAHADRRVGRLEQVVPLYQEAVAFQRAGDNGKALQTLGELEPGDCAAPSYLAGLCLAREAEWGRAEAALLRALRCYGGSEAIWNHLAEVYLAWDVGRARAACQRVIALTEGSDDERKLERRSRALERRDETLAAAARAVLAARAAEHGLWAQALTDLDAALEHAGGDASLRWRRAQALVKLGRADEAVAELERALALGETPWSDRLRSTLGDLQVR